MESFINGLQNDYDATLNAIQLPYNNRLAEESVNKKYQNNNVWKK